MKDYDELPYPRVVLLHNSDGDIRHWLRVIDLDGQQRWHLKETGQGPHVREGLEWALQGGTAPCLSASQPPHLEPAGAKPEVQIRIRPCSERLEGTRNNPFWQSVGRIGWHVTFASLSHSSHSMCDLRIVANANWFIGQLAQLANNLRSQHVFTLLSQRSGDMHLFPALEDRDAPQPIRRAWDLMYFGPRLVDEVGWPAIASAPAYLTTRDDHGGAWIRLCPNPFDPPADIEQRRQAFARYLDLNKRFQWLPDPPAALPQP